MNDNSYIDWPKEKFIDVLEGKDANYIQRDDFPGSIGQRAYGSTLKSYSLKNNFSIYVPNQQERLQHKLIGSHDLNQTPDAPAVESTIVYRISEKVTWDRRANRGEGSELYWLLESIC